MTRLPRFRTPIVAIIGLSLSPLVGCQSQRNPLSGLDEAERAIPVDRPRTRGGPSDPTGTPPLVINRQPVSWDELAGVLAESGGAGAIEELALTRSLKIEMAARGQTLDSEAARREERLLAVSLTQSDGIETSQVAAVVADLKNARGLGPVRYAMLLERNAMLRSLVRDQVALDEASLRTAFDIRHGTRRTVRLIVVSTQREASTIRARLLSAATEPRAAFIQAAIDSSTDATAARGGLTEPISPLDPAYAPTVRRMLQSLEPGRISPIVAVDNGFALMLLEQDIPADGVAFENVRNDLERLVRLRQERLLMDRLARQLLDSASITAFDESLNWAWKNRRSR